MGHDGLINGESEEQAEGMPLLLCATNAGGARNIAAIASELYSNRKWTAKILTTRTLAPLFDGLKDRACLLFAEEMESGMDQVIESLSVRAVICGTTCYESADREIIVSARRRDVPSIAIVDEWYNYQHRFLRGGRMVPDALPSAIALPDDLARQEAINDGLPAAICHATGSPALARIWDCAQEWNDTPPPLPAAWASCKDMTKVLFLSETHAQDYGDQVGSVGPLGEFLGYTEDSVRQEILYVMESIPRKFLFIDQWHPSSRDAIPPKHIPKNVRYLSSRGDSLWPTAFHSDTVLGMRSMGLLEAFLLGCKVASFQPGLVGEQICTAVRLGLIPCMQHQRDLKAWLSQNHNSVVRNKGEGKRPDFARPDSATRILNLLPY